MSKLLEKECMHINVGRMHVFPCTAGNCSSDYVDVCFLVFSSSQEEQVSGVCDEQRVSFHSGIPFNLAEYGNYDRQIS